MRASYSDMPVIAGGGENRGHAFELRHRAVKSRRIVIRPWS
jgi:hypothetical protein